MTGRRLSAEEAAAHRREQLEGLQQQLTDQVAKLTSSDQWMRMLQMASRMHNYSFRNLCLIVAQNENASQVAGYRTWQQLGRQVRKGEHGIAILAPLRGKHDVEDTQTGERSTVPVIRGFKIEHVWDMSQTDGEPLPDVGPRRLEGEAPSELWDRVVTLFAEDGYTVTRDVPHHPTANGELVPSTHQVRVHPDLGPLAALKTLLHERAHLSLGHTEDMAAYRSHRGQFEVEAESTAFVIAGSWGLDTSAYSVGYVTHWAEGDLAKITRTADRVVSTAHETLDRLTPRVELEPAGIGVEL
jgi:antirestriction protein ArdC